uniref:Aldose 1-epimerase n=1 Tax=Parascaris univalens TaxID=6257 RepID=A0A915CBP2_PARUN
MSESDFGDYEGKKVKLITLTNSNGMRVELLSFGAIIKSIIVKDKCGVDRDVVLGCNQIDGFITDDAYMGATVGRVCNRIANASFELNGKKYDLPANNGKHHLHGGGCLSKRVWEVDEIRQCDGMQSVKFTTVSRDGEFGYPGDVRFDVTFEVDNHNKLNVLHEAFSLSDTSTIVNLTVHPYFNLDPQMSADVLDHELMIKANTYLAVDEMAVATGEICSLNGDLKKLREGVCLRELTTSGAIDIDNDFILDCKPGDEALRLRSERSGIILTLSTSYPVIHLYLAQHFNNIKGKMAQPYGKYAGIAIEAHKYSNAINIPHFPSIVLNGHSKYSEWISFSLTCTSTNN